jgi:hypothetical protein
MQRNVHPEPKCYGGLWWRTTTRVNTLRQAPAPVDSRQQFIGHISALVGRILTITRQERRDPGRLLDAHSWKDRIRQRFQKAF